MTDTNGVQKEVVISPPPQTLQVDVGNALINPENLNALIKNEKAIRKLIKNFIKSQLVEGTDYGKIHIKKDCSNKFTCKDQYHFSKDTLLKSGAEKFTSLFHLKPIFERDDLTWEVIGKRVGVFCFVCKLVNSRGEVVAEGRGICSEVEKSGQTNNAIKIAEKRAQLDAVLRHGGLSDFFTQDLEDTDLINTETGAKKNKSNKIGIPSQPIQLDVVNPIKPPEEIQYVCYEGAEIITKAERDYSIRLYKKPLCRKHQMEITTKK